eukprot:SAG31_NODE_224_length_19856_cov_33.632890_6_plen_74_part_00
MKAIAALVVTIASLSALVSAGRAGAGQTAAAAAHLQIFSMYGDDPSGQQGIVNVRLNVVPYRRSQQRLLVKLA